MNARVFLLVLVTSAFAAIWDADRPTASRLSMNHASASLQEKSNSRASNGLIPLPSNLQSGTWLAFNHNGDTFRITIQNRTPKPSAVPADRISDADSEKEFLVMTGSDGVRWCLVMEQPKSAVGDRSEWH